MMRLNPVDFRRDLPTAPSLTDAGRDGPRPSELAETGRDGRRRAETGRDEPGC